MKFIHEDFLLSTRTARRLYHEFAEAEPIFDYHCHLSPRDIAENRQFNNLFEIWLEGDHYKWRAMRSNGVPERCCAGEAEPFEKFMAWAATVPYTLRNPLYHWTHLELKRYFGIEELLDERSAPRIWKQANERLAGPQLTTQGILKKFKVTTLCTTDDPVDDLKHHLKPLPPRAWRRWSCRPSVPTRRWRSTCPAASMPGSSVSSRPPTWTSRTCRPCWRRSRRRHDFFHQHGCRLSDHGLDRCHAEICPETTAAAIFERARAGQAASALEHQQFASFMMLFFGRLDAEKGWTQQLHLGPLRNNNTRLLRLLGPDTGFDSIGDLPQAAALAAFLDALDREQALARTILYNVNPADNYVFAAMLGNFQDGTIPGKLQWGSGWWFLDQKEGIEWQLNALSNLGLLSRFVGMVTDSRSFMSYPRHEYFRRVLCNVLGREVEQGEIPNDPRMLGPMIRNICYSNARQYFGLPSAPPNAPPAQPTPARSQAKPTPRRSPRRSS